MNQSPQTPLSEEQNAKLMDFRRQIDTIDDQLIALLSKRIGIVKQVGKMKRSVNPNHCPLRPGREADMVRDIARKFEGTGFSPAAAAAIWRLLIGASTAEENDLTISVYAPDGDNTLYWAAREYFGPFLHIICQPHINRVIGDVADKKAAVGLVPELNGSDDSHWWSSLLGSIGNTPVIFAHVPFVHYDVPGRKTPSALAIGHIQPEETDEDRSVIVLEADQNVSQHKLQSTLNEAGLDTSWVDMHSFTPDRRHHLLQIKGFVSPDHPAIQQVKAKLEKALLHVYFLGAYAVPFTLKFEPTRE